MHTDELGCNDANSEPQAVPEPAQPEIEINTESVPVEEIAEVGPEATQPETPDSEPGTAVTRVRPAVDAFSPPAWYSPAEVERLRRLGWKSAPETPISPAR
jgi:hypothetical protein